MRSFGSSLLFKKCTQRTPATASYHVLSLLAIRDHVTQENLLVDCAHHYHCYINCAPHNCYYIGWAPYDYSVDLIAVLLSCQGFQDAHCDLIN